MEVATLFAGIKQEHQTRISGTTMNCDTLLSIATGCGPDNRIRFPIWARNFIFDWTGSALEPIQRSINTGIKEQQCETYISRLNLLRRVRVCGDFPKFPNTYS